MYHFFTLQRSPLQSDSNEPFVDDNVLTVYCVYVMSSFSVITFSRGDGEAEEQQRGLLQDNSSDEGSPNRRYVFFC